MTPKAISETFISLFCEPNIDALADLLSEDFKFSGPLLKSADRDAYIAALRKDPPQKATYSIRSAIEEKNRTSLLYEYRKQEASILIAQFFTIAEGLIQETELVFDCRTE